MWIKPGKRCGVIFRLELHHFTKFLAGPTARTPHFHYGSMGSIPGELRSCKLSGLKKKKINDITNVFTAYVFIKYVLRPLN